MNLKKNLFSIVCILALGLGFTACSNNDDDERLDDAGSVVELPKQRVFFLNEGSYQGNNANLMFFDPNHTTASVDDIFNKQNNAKLGDTAQDLIVYNNQMYIVMSGSRYIARLNSAGVEQARHAFSEADGDPRYAAAKDGKIYVTLYSGQVVRLDANTLQPEAYAKVGKNPEHLIIEDDKIYVVNGGWGYDNRLSIIDIKSFTVENVTISYNMSRIVEADDKLFIQGYGGEYGKYTYPVEYYNPKDQTVTKIASATDVVAYDDMLYMVYSDTDWSTYTTTNTFFSYNAETGKLNNTSFLKNAPAALATSSIYMMEVNPNNGEIYIGTSNYTSNGTIYRFKNDGTYMETIESSGINPNNAVFFN